MEYFWAQFGGHLIGTFCQDCANSERPCSQWVRRKPAWRPTCTYFGERLGKKLRKSRVLKSLKIIPNHVIWSLRFILRHISDFLEFTPLAILFAPSALTHTFPDTFLSFFVRGDLVLCHKVSRRSRKVLVKIDEMGEGCSLFRHLA